MTSSYDIPVPLDLSSIHDSLSIPIPLDLSSDPDSRSVRGSEQPFTHLCMRYRQGNRTVYSLELSLTDLIELLPKPDPSVPTPGNRAINRGHAAKFGDYLRAHEGWVAPAIILRAPSIFTFKPLETLRGFDVGHVRVSRVDSREIQILDGQHRVLGIHVAYEAVMADLISVRGLLDRARQVDSNGTAAVDATKRLDELTIQSRRLRDERMSVQIYEESDPAAYKQMFFDIAENALGISESVKTRFDSRKVVNRTFSAVVEHPLLKDRVDHEKDRVTSKNSPFLLGAKHVAEMIKIIAVGLDGRISRRREDELDQDALAVEAKAFLDVLVESFEDLKQVNSGLLSAPNLRLKSILGSTVVLRVIGGVYHELSTQHGFDRPRIVEYFRTISPHVGAPVASESIWMRHTDVFTEGALAPHSRRQDQAALRDALVSWAVERPDWFQADSTGHENDGATARS